MELDLTRLNSLASMDFTGKKEAPKKPSETLKGEGEYKTPIEVKKPLEALTEGLEGINKLQREADRKKQDIDRVELSRQNSILYTQHLHTHRPMRI